MNPFTQRVIETIKNIPAGRVMTYGQIAGLAGSPRGARQVVRILHSMSKKHNLPWHRVINAKGQIAIADEEAFQMQKLLLEMEGIAITNDSLLDLDRYQFKPSIME